MCWSWFYKAVNPLLRKADHLSLAIGDMVCGQLLSIAISWAKNEFKFLCELGWILQRQSHLLIMYIASTYVHTYVRRYILYRWNDTRFLRDKRNPMWIDHKIFQGYPLSMWIDHVDRGRGSLIKEGTCNYFVTLLF